MADIILDLYDEDVTVTIQDPEEISLDIQDPENININVTDNGSKGDPGDPGLNWLGDWDSLVNYVAKDGVYYQGSTFICKLGNNNQAPFEGSSYWDIAAKKGQGSTPKGAYNAGTAYIVDDIVEHNGSAYNCISPTTGNAPPNATYWELFVSKGDDGATGPAGTGINWLGDWDNGTAYAVNDAVFNNGSAFVCNTSHTGEEPPDPTYWDSFANGLRYRGDWSGVIDYNLGDLARSSGTVYICILGHTNQAPPNATYWEIFSEKGDTGAAGADGTDGYSVLEGAGVPSNGLGGDGDHYIDTTNRILYVGKASGDWANATQIPLAANPNGARFTVGSNSQNPNASSAIAIELTNEVYKDSGVIHSNITNPSRFGPDTDKGGRYNVFVAISYNNPSAIRINLNLYLRKNGTTDLNSDGETFSGYNRNNGGSVTSTAFLMWSGDLLDSDYLEVMSKQGDIAGTVSIIANSYVDFKQITLLENQTGGGSGYGWGAWTDLTLNTTNLWNDTHRNAQYRVSDDGNDVELRGVVQRTGSIASRVLTMPSGARPPTGANVPAFITANTTALGPAYAWITSAGELWFTGYAVSDLLELGGIKFQTVYPL